MKVHWISHNTWARMKTVSRYCCPAFNAILILYYSNHNMLCCIHCNWTKINNLNLLHVLLFLCFYSILLFVLIAGAGEILFLYFSVLYFHFLWKSNLILNKRSFVTYLVSLKYAIYEQNVFIGMDHIWTKCIYRNGPNMNKVYL